MNERKLTAPNEGTIIAVGKHRQFLFCSSESMQKIPERTFTYRTDSYYDPMIGGASLKISSDFFSVLQLDDRYLAASEWFGPARVIVIDLHSRGRIVTGLGSMSAEQRRTDCVNEICRIGSVRRGSVVGSSHGELGMVAATTSAGTLRIWDWRNVVAAAEKAGADSYHICRLRGRLKGKKADIRPVLEVTAARVGMVRKCAFFAPLCRVYGGTSDGYLLGYELDGRGTVTKTRESSKRTAGSAVFGIETNGEVLYTGFLKNIRIREPRRSRDPVMSFCGEDVKTTKDKMNGVECIRVGFAKPESEFFVFSNGMILKFDLRALASGPVHMAQHHPAKINWADLTMMDEDRGVSTLHFGGGPVVWRTRDLKKLAENTDAEQSYLGLCALGSDLDRFGVVIGRSREKKDMDERIAFVFVQWEASSPSRVQVLTPSMKLLTPAGFL